MPAKTIHHYKEQDDVFFCFLYFKIILFYKGYSDDLSTKKKKKNSLKLQSTTFQKQVFS